MNNGCFLWLTTRLRVTRSRKSERNSTCHMPHPDLFGRKCEREPHEPRECYWQVHAPAKSRVISERLDLQSRRAPFSSRDTITGTRCCPVGANHFPVQSLERMAGSRLLHQAVGLRAERPVGGQPHVSFEGLGWASAWYAERLRQLPSLELL